LRIAVDITHPAHFHFFKHAIRTWIESGDEVLVLSRDKDLTLNLLDEAGMTHICLSRAGKGLAGLAFEYGKHSFGVFHALRRHQTQVVVAIGGTFIVAAARMQRIPALVFYDTENAVLSNRITYPLATRIYTPRSYRSDLGAKQSRYNGFQELAYLHPRRFQASTARLSDAGIKIGEPFTFIRLVAWNSHHDVGDFGVRDPQRVVERLAAYGRVVISSEAPLPTSLEPYALPSKVSDVHHVLAFAKLTFGESATMASEGAQLGVPGIFLSTSSRGYTDELQNRYQMVFNFNGRQAIEEQALACAESILSDPSAPDTFHRRWKKMLDEQSDITQIILDAVAEHVPENQS